MAETDIFIGVLVREDRRKEVAAYIYPGVIFNKEHDTYISTLKLMTYQAVDASLAQQQADRLSSGLFGARVCDADGLDAMIKEFSA